MFGSDKRRNLSSEMTLFAVAISAVSIVAVGLAATAGIYRFAVGERSAEFQVQQQLLADALDNRFTAAARVISSLAIVESERVGKHCASRDVVAEALGVNGDCFDVIAVVGPGSRLVVESRASVSTPSRDVLEKAASAPQADRTAAAWVEAADTTSPPGVWIARRMPTESGERVSVVGRVRARYLTQIVEDLSAEKRGRVTLIVDDEARTIAWAGLSERPDLVGVSSVSHPVRTGSGTLRLSSAALDRYVCSYSLYDGLPGIRWRLVVGRPAGEMLGRFGRALAPAAAVVLVMLGVSIQAVGSFGRRIVTPMRTLERSARQVSSGEYTRPVPIDRDDEIGRLGDAFNAMARRLNALQDLAQLVAGASSLDQVLDAIVTAVDHILRTGDVGVFLVDGSTGDLTLARAVGCCSGGHCRITLADPSVVTAAFRSGRPTVLDLPQEPSAGERDGDGLFRERGLSTVLAVPLVTSGTTVGVVVAASCVVRRFTEAEMETVRTFSAHAAVALENSRLFEHEHRARREAEALREVAGLLAGPLDRDDALEGAAGVTADLTGAARARVVIAGASAEEDERLLGLVRPDDGSVDNEPVVLSDGVGQGGDVMLVPLSGNDALTGALVVQAGPEKDGFTPREVRLAATVGTQMSLALENIRLLEQATTRATNLERIFRISRAVSSSLDVQVVLNRVLDVVQAIFSAEAVSLMTEDPLHGTLSTAMARGVKNADMLRLRLRPGEDLPGEVFESRRPRRVSDLRAEHGAVATMAAGQGLRCMLAVPLLARGRSIGVLSVFSADDAAYSDADMELLLTFASQAALAIDTATLYGREHHVASVLQSSIQPGELPELSGLDTASVCVPASIEADIGGDYIDMFVAPDGRVVLAIGDVCGKGVEAATKTSMIKYLLRGVVAAGLGPSDAVAQLNRAVATTGDISDIVTMWVGFFDVRDGALDWADAGHPAALVLHAAGDRVERLGPTGPLLGAVEDARYGTGTTRIEPGSVLLLYTDGVTEARGTQGMFGEGRVRRYLRKGGSAGDLTRRLLAAVRRFSGPRLRDDAAILAVRVLCEDEG